MHVVATVLVGIILSLLTAQAAYAAPRATQTIDQALGCTKSIESVLAAHESDGYYLGTSYGNTGPNGAGGAMDTWDCRYPNGAPKPGVGGYMNCAGFVSRVVMDAGGDVSGIATWRSAQNGPNPNYASNDTNARKWYYWALDNGVAAYSFDTKEQMLASGVLQKGDIIFINADFTQPGADNHIGFFWGDHPSDDKFWHSSETGDDVTAGSRPGNMISRITPKSPATGYLVIKTQHEVDVTFQKVSSLPGVDISVEGYSLKGATYEIRRAADDGLVGTYTTGADGTFSATLSPNTAYYAVETVAPEGFTLNPDRIGFNTGKVTSVNLPDAPKVTVTFTKTSADAELTDGNAAYAYAGATYEIYQGTYPNGTRVATVTTDAQGHASCKLDANTSYYALETKAPQGFIASTDPIAFKTGSTPSEQQLSDEPGTVVLTVRKKDAATGGAAQPGASLAGATYQLTDANGNVHTATTDSQGVCRFSDIPLGTSKVVETKAPAGYKLDSTVHTYTVRADQMGETGVVELTPTDDFIEHPIAFDIELVKYLDNAEEGSGLQQPAAGIRFEVVSNTTGKVVGSITTDEHGSASTVGQWFGAGERRDGISGALPYDAQGYTVREDGTTTPHGFKPVDDWQITADQMVDGATLHYIVDNAQVQSRIQVVKTDAETGRTVPVAGFTFQLLDEDKKPVAQEVWYPNHAEVSEFTTDASGMVTFPEALQSGTYYVRETAATSVYLLNEEDVKVEVSSDFDAAPLVVVTLSDNQAMGQATITKTCAVTDHDEPAAPSDGMGTVDAGCTGVLASAEFDVVAMEDVVSPDGTVRAVESEVVDHVVTGKDGTATTKKLYLGSGSATYAFIETEAPQGHVLDTTPHEFTLSSADDTTPLVEVDVAAEDAPTETVLDKSVLGHDDALPGAAFSIWSADDEHAVVPEEGMAAFALDGTDADDSKHTVQLSSAADTSQVTAEVPDNLLAALVDAEGIGHVVTAGTTMLEPGHYTLELMDSETREAVEFSGDAELELTANGAYTLTVKRGFFSGLTATFEQSGTVAEPIEITYDDKLGAYVATSLEPGTYRVTVDGEQGAKVMLAVGETKVFGLTETGRVEELPALLADDAEPWTATTDDAGRITIHHMGEGSYRIVEVAAPDGFLVDDEIRYFTVDRNGLTEGMPSYRMNVEDDYTKIDLSKRDITDESEVVGAQLAILDADGETVETWTSTEEDHRIEALAPGTYTLVELKTPHSYDEATAVDFTVEETGEVQRVVMYDEPIEVSGEIDKRQQIADPAHPYTEADETVENGGSNRAATTVSEDGTYSYTVDFRSTSTTWVDEFTVTDELEAAENGLATLTGITMPVAGEDYDGLVNVWYRTDATPSDYIDPTDANATLGDGHENPWLGDELTAERLGDDGRVVDYAGWKLWAADLPVDNPGELAVANLGLAEGEVVTAVRLEYGRVEKGFTSRADGWERDDLKDAHDDIENIAEDQTGSPLVLHMQVTDDYRAGTVLKNSAHVELYRNGGSIEDHEQLEDHDEDHVEQHPVERAPSIGTSLTDKEDGDHEVEPGAVTLIDTVTYEGLEPGIVHTLTGTLRNRATGAALTDAEGEVLTATVTFTPSQADGEAEVAFELNTADLEGADLVAFETLSYREEEMPDDSEADNAGESGGSDESGDSGESDDSESSDSDNVIAEHADLDDAGQTVHVRGEESASPLAQTGTFPLALALVATGFLAAAAWYVTRHRKP